MAAAVAASDDVESGVVRSRRISQQLVSRPPPEMRRKASMRYRHELLQRPKKALAVLCMSSIGELIEKEWEKWKTLIRELRKQPQLAFMPFCTLVVFIFCGTFSVSYTADKAAAVERDIASSLFASVVAVR